MKEVHVSNVPYAATEQQLKDFLESITNHGAVSYLELKRESFSAGHKGFGFVTFVRDDVAEAVRMYSTSTGLWFLGRLLRINFSMRQVRHNPEHTTTRLEAGSFSMGCLAGTTLHVLWSKTQRVETEFDFRDRKLNFRFKIPNDSTGIPTPYRLEFRFKHLYCCYNATVSSSSTSAGRMLLLEIWNPPQIYQEEKPRTLEALFGSISFEDSSLAARAPKPTWVRTVDFTVNCSIAQSFAYLVEYPDTPSSRPELSRTLRTLQDYRLATGNTRRLELRSASPYADLSPGVLVPLVKCPNGIVLPFKILFKLNQAVQVGNLCGPNLSANFYRLLSRANEEHALWVLQKILSSVTQAANPESWLESELRQIRAGEVRVPRSTAIELENGLIWVYRVLVSPTKIICLGPEAEVSNRVTRQYVDVIDNFLRLSFIEEDGSNLSSQALLSSEDQRRRSDVYKRILGVLSGGLWLYGKHYEFLAFSSSQLREQSVWMFARSGNVTAESIRAWMGNFLDIRNVAKCAARMGQCFSSTTKTMVVNWWEVEHIEDIRTPDRKYCFSDGIGKISASFAERVARKCSCRGFVPSAFQIRFGGHKGVVAISPDSVDKLSLRPSMRKFESDHPDLEVISWTKPLPCYLNRQVITLLATLGIRDNIFQQMQSTVMANLDRVVSQSMVALDILHMTSSGATHQTTMAMLRAGYSPTSEPYLLSLLQAFRAFQLLQLRTKSRIFVPKGRTLMGCLDETGILGYGQVFVQVSSFPGTRTVLSDGLAYKANGTCIVTGAVVVAKNPCLHPGDVRVLQAVNVPQLHHMVDCLVFPQQGHRPHPNECSGSDLDGDLYFVSWDALLIPRVVADPMDYTPAEAVVLNRPVTIQDIQEFFADYMMSDSLGLIANAHVVHADKEPEMARTQKCLDLAHLFMVAVDFPKTGKPAVMEPNLRATTYPDFMEKDDKNSYESEKVLGKLFREVVGEARQTLISTITKDRIVDSFDGAMEWSGFDSYISEARILKEWYDTKLVSLMKQYDIKTEAEALSGNILPLSRFYVKKQGELKDRISLAVRSLQSEARYWFKHGCDVEVEDTGYSTDSGRTRRGLEEHEAFAKASAWYHVTYHRRYLSPPLDITGGPADGFYLLSFPWVVHETLLEVKRRNRGQY